MARVDNVCVVRLGGSTPDVVCGLSPLDAKPLVEGRSDVCVITIRGGAAQVFCGEEAVTALRI